MYIDLKVALNSEHKAPAVDAHQLWIVLPIYSTSEEHGKYC